MHATATNKYLDLVRAFPLRTLRSAHEHAEAIKVLARLLGRPSGRLSAGEQNYAEIPARLIDDFGAPMKKHNNFSNAQQGKLSRPAKTLHIPIYLDEDVRRKLVGKNNRASANVTKIVNAIQRSQIGVVEMLK